mgnify:CR=1 FL=1
MAFAARVRQARADIGDRSVRAPFAGVLGIRQVSPGSLITANSTIATLDDVSRMYVDFQVPEAELWEHEQGAQWLRVLVLAVIFVFGLKGGVGVERISEFFHQTPVLRNEESGFLLKGS